MISLSKCCSKLPRAHTHSVLHRRLTQRQQRRCRGFWAYFFDEMSAVPAGVDLTVTAKGLWERAGAGDEVRQPSIEECRASRAAHEVMH